MCSQPAHNCDSEDVPGSYVLEQGQPDGATLASIRATSSPLLSSSNERVELLARIFLSAIASGPVTGRCAVVFGG
jgi:hypothetical protein